jgi:hypothetical protein
MPLLMSPIGTAKPIGRLFCLRTIEQEVRMNTVKHLLEVARFRRHKAHCLLRDAPNMPLAEERARLTQYATFFEQEAVKLEKRAGDLYDSSRSEHRRQSHARLMKRRRL